MSTPAPASPAAAPPLSPALFAGLLLRPVPDAVLNRALAAVMSRTAARHPELLSRLPQNCRGDVLITLTDLRLTLALHLDPPQARLRIATAADRAAAVAGICGAVQVLIDLAEGRVDGDAMFFSRDLAFDGDTEIVVALRNALDGADLSVADFLPLPPVLPVRALAAARTRLAGWAAAIHAAARRDIELIRAAATAPLERTVRQQKSKISKLESRLAEVESKLARGKRKAEVR